MPAPMASKTDMVFARVEPELKRALARCAKADDRKDSYIVRKAVIEYLQARGFLPKDYAQPAVDEDDG